MRTTTEEGGSAVNTEANYAVAPGSFVEEWLEDEGLTQGELAERLDVSRKTVNKMLRGGVLSAELAHRIELVTSIPADFLLRIEAKYRSDLERIKHEHSLASHIAKVPQGVRRLLKQLGVVSTDGRNPGQFMSEFLAFHRCGTWEAFEDLHGPGSKADYALAFRKESRSSELDPVALATWLRACELAPEMDGIDRLTYSESALWEILPELRHRAASPDATMFDDIAEMLRGTGVVLTHLEPPTSFPLYGVTRWVGGVPVIHQTFRRRRDGYVTFTLFHELGHVLHDPRGETHLDDIGSGVKSEAEKRANSFAMDFLLPQEHRVRVRSLRYDNEIRDVARELDVSPGFLVFYMQRTKALDRRHGNALPVQL
jgi:HTH-type transcriptional regulator / antitoxin HigA